MVTGAAPRTPGLQPDQSGSKDLDGGTFAVSWALALLNQSRSKMASLPGPNSPEPETELLDTFVRMQVIGHPNQSA